MAKTPSLAVRNDAQKALFEYLQSQISDGYWENKDTDVVLWSCKVTVIPYNVGIAGKLKHPIDFLDIYAEGVDDEMIAACQKVDPKYNQRRLLIDLEDLTNIIYGGKK